MFETRDFFLAVFLMTADFPLLELRLDEKGRKHQELFVFSASEELERAVSDYGKDASRVNPRLYAQNITSLRNRIKGK